MALRSKNRCNDCEHEWLAPYGEDLSSRCPRCHSAATEVIERAGPLRTVFDLLLGTVVFGVVIVVLCVVAAPFLLVGLMLLPIAPGGLHLAMHGLRAAAHVARRRLGIDIEA